MSKILIIDDSDLIGRLLSDTLLEQGYDVRVASDAHRGYETAIEFLPDLMLVDVHLPDLIGFDLIRVLRNAEPLQRVPIILITGAALLV